MMNETTQHFEEWPYKWLSCLLLGTLTMLTSITALLGIISEPWMAWNEKILMSLLLHPFNFTLGFVVMFFSMTTLENILHRPVCIQLVKAAVTSQWGVPISTLTFSLGRSLFLLIHKTSWLSFSFLYFMNSYCTMVVSAMLMVLNLYTLTLVISHISLPMKSGHDPGISCAQFFTSVEMFPRTAMRFFILSTNIFIVISLAIIITHIRKRRNRLSVGVMQAQDLIRLQPLAFPPDERAHPLQAMAANPNPAPYPEHANDVNRNARTSLPMSRNENQVQNSFTNNANNLDLDLEPEDDEEFYDSERLRHRAQSPPPQPANQQLNVNHQFIPVPQEIYNDLPILPFIRPPPLDNNARNQNRDEIQNQQRFVLPAAFLDLIFPHRETPNKPRFRYTKVQHTREFSWPIVDHDGIRLAYPIDHVLDHDGIRLAYPIDHVLCASCFLYIMSYTPLACYLLYTSDDPSFRFTDISFEPFISILLIKASLDSFLHFVCMQKLPCLQ